MPTVLHSVFGVGGMLLTLKCFKLEHTWVKPSYAGNNFSSTAKLCLIIETSYGVDDKVTLQHCTVAHHCWCPA